VYKGFIIPSYYKKTCESSLLWPSQDRFTRGGHLFKVNPSNSEYILELLDNSKMKRNLKLVLFKGYSGCSSHHKQKDADILTVTVAAVLYKHLTVQMPLSQYRYPYSYSCHCAVCKGVDTP
jgi:hypothetical protein